MNKIPLLSDKIALFRTFILIFVLIHWFATIQYTIQCYILSCQVKLGRKSSNHQNNPWKKLIKKQLRDFNLQFYVIERPKFINAPLNSNVWIMWIFIYMHVLKQIMEWITGHMLDEKCAVLNFMMSHSPQDHIRHTLSHS